MLSKLPVVLGWVGGLALSDLPAEPPPIVMPLPPVQVAVSSGCFLPVPATAVRLGSRLLAKHLSETLNRPVELQLCESEEGMLRVLGTGRAQVAMMTGDSLVRGRRLAIPLEPVMMSDAQPGTRSSWVLLARAGQTWTSLGRGPILIADGGQGSLPALWFNHLRQGDDGGGGMPAISESRPEIAVLRAYLGKADACVVPESVFVAACGDNPDVASRLLPMATSPPLPGSVVTLCPGSGPDSPSLRKAVGSLATTPHGRALATLLRSAGWGPVDKSVLLGLEKMVPLGPARPAVPAGPTRRAPPAVSSAPAPPPASLSRPRR